MAFSAGRPISFRMQLSAPTTPGVYGTRWSMIQQGQGAFGEEVTLLITVTVPEPVVVPFYNNSAWDGGSSAANAADDNAVAAKTTLRPGTTATFANYTSYDKGINGLMIDVQGLPGTPTVNDFLFRRGNDDKPYGNDLNNPADDWSWAPDPVTVAVRPGAGTDGADRITLIWEDGVIRNCWLQVTVLASDATGLAVNDVFYVGNAVGESGNSATDALVNATDEIGARNDPHGPFTPAPKDDVYDYNRDKLVNATDQILARNNRTSPFTALKLITPPLEDDGSGEGEGEWSGDVWTTWTDRSLFESSVPLDSFVARESLVVPSANSSDFPRLSALTSVPWPTWSTATCLGVSSLNIDLLPRDAVDGLLTLPVSLSAMTASPTIDVSDRTATLRMSEADWLAPWAASSPGLAVCWKYCSGFPVRRNLREPQHRHATLTIANVKLVR